MGKLVFTTAIVVIPPENVWPAIQAIRWKHDAKVRRWMPHITLVYPCLPVAAFPVAQDRLEIACRGIGAFSFTHAHGTQDLQASHEHGQGDHPGFPADHP